MLMTPFDWRHVGAVDVNIPSPTELTSVIVADFDKTQPKASVTSTEYTPEVNPVIVLPVCALLH
jgi:hypothetical protein